MMYESEVENKQGEPELDKSPNAVSARLAWRFWLPRIATAILVPILLLGAMELGLRLLGVGYSTDLTQPCTVHGRPAACYNLFFPAPFFPPGMIKTCLLYTSDAADEEDSVDLGGRRI